MKDARLEILTFTLGPAQTNAYLVADPAARAAAAIDPAWDGAMLAGEAERRGWRIQAIWLTHAHFDHFAGSPELSESLKTPVPIALHLPINSSGEPMVWLGFSACAGSILGRNRRFLSSMAAGCGWAGTSSKCATARATPLATCSSSFGRRGSPFAAI